MSVIDTVSNFVNKHLPRSGRVIVGLSGGADSVALLVALVDAGVECVAAHCNFHLRGEESNRDHRFCEELCGRLGVELLSRDFDVAAVKPRLLNPLRWHVARCAMIGGED